MSKFFALLALLLILSGAILLAVPRAPDSGGSRGLAPEAAVAPGVLTQAREIAEQVNAPLSILFGLVSLFYSRRSYQVNRARAEAAQASGKV